jgi:hypothetical protein
MRAGLLRYALAPFALCTAVGLVLPAQADGKEGATDVNYGSGAAPTEKDYAATREVIVRHIDDPVPALTERARPRQTLRGVVTEIDERNDRLTVRLASNATGDFKVQDGLVFDAVHPGDAVELIVENIAGARTIVGLTIERAQ